MPRQDPPVRNALVRVAQIVGVRDAHYGEVPAAFIELNPNTTIMSEAVIIEFCRDMIAAYKDPRYVRLSPVWPMSGTKVTFEPEMGSPPNSTQRELSRLLGYWPQHRFFERGDMHGAQGSK